MAKIIILKLAGIEYAGDSIGDDIRIEIEGLRSSVSINKKIRNGERKEINIEIGQFISDKTAWDFNGEIRIIERDAIFNDVGRSSIKMRVDLADPSLQHSTHEVKVHESRGISSGGTALFRITLNAQAMEATRYVEDVDTGWLKVLPESSKKEISLPAHLKVQIYRVDDQREYFTVAEGVLRGTKASVKRKPGGLTHLSIINPHTKAMQAIYSISKKTLEVSGKKYLAKDYPAAKWTKGVYDIEIPDHPHEGGLRYKEKTKRATSWFRVGHSGDRYIHTGSNSLGCITLIENNRWDELYEILIKARKGDSLSIGVLKVID